MQQPYQNVYNIQQNFYFPPQPPIILPEFKLPVTPQFTSPWEMTLPTGYFGWQFF
jgi:hypothetical protein